MGHFPARDCHDDLTKVKFDLLVAAVTSERSRGWHPRASHHQSRDIQLQALAQIFDSVAKMRVSLAKEVTTVAKDVLIAD